MLIDKIRELVSFEGDYNSYDITEDEFFRLVKEGFEALIAVDDVLKEYVDYPKWTDGTYKAGEAMLADEIRKAIEGE